LVEKHPGYPQELQNCRNTQSKSIGKAKAVGEDIKPLLNAVADLGDKIEYPAQGVFTYKSFKELYYVQLILRQRCL
jgi:seryl-tRNA synthetase